MTHLSDFSYLQRSTLEVYIAIFLFYRIWSSDRLRCLHPKKLFDGELRTIITYLYIIMLLMQTSWDMTSTWIKYNEGFIQDGKGHIFNKPFEYWIPKHQDIAQAIDYVECVNLSMQTGVFFLLQCFWNYLSNAVAKKSFMGSWEFKFYIFWAIGSVAIFPILQWYFRNDVNLREAAPQLAYAIEVLITTILGVRSHFRFKRILNISQNMKHGGAAIVEKLAYFKDMNMYFTAVLFFYGLSLVILCIDGMTAAKVINSNKFAADLLIANCNTATVMIWIVGISIFHPRRSNVISASSAGESRSVAATTTNNRFHAVTEEPGHMSNYNNNYNKNNGASFTENLKVNGHRLSQRITNFIDRNTGLQFQEKDHNGGSFMRNMTPVEVDYLKNNAYQQQNMSVSVDDPYSNTSINFTMVEPLKNKRMVPQRPSMESSYRSVSPQQHNYPMHTINSVSSQRQDMHYDDERSYDYASSQSRLKNPNDQYHY